MHQVGQLLRKHSKNKTHITKTRDILSKQDTYNQNKTHITKTRHILPKHPQNCHKTHALQNKFKQHLFPKNW